MKFLMNFSDSDWVRPKRVMLEADFYSWVFGGFFRFIHFQLEVLGALADGGVAGLGEHFTLGLFLLF